MIIFVLLALFALCIIRDEISIAINAEIVKVSTKCYYRAIKLIKFINL